MEGNSDTLLRSVAKIEEAAERSLTFFANPKYEPYVYTTRAAAIIVSEDFVPAEKIKPVLIRVKDARVALAKLLEIYEQMTPPKMGIEQPSYISEQAKVGADIYVGAFAYVAEGAKIGNGVKIYPQAYIGDGVEVGDDTIIYSGAKIYKGCKIGKRCVVHSGCVIGADGFGFAPDAEGNYQKVAQIGNVVIDDDVEIGANTCIDRATMGSTHISRGTKLDNLIQIAHNVEVGADTVIAAQTGVAGSTKIGDRCVFAGQVGIAGHIQIANRTTCAAQTGVNSAVKTEGTTIFGSPAMDYMDFNRSFVIFRRLPQLKRDLDAIKAQMDKQ